MLVRDLKRIALVVGPIVGLLLISVSLWDSQTYSSLRSQVGDLVGKPHTAAGVDPNAVGRTHHEIFSRSTPDKKYFPITFGNYTAFNPNIIPHPTRNDTWIIVSQKRRVNPDGSDPDEHSVFNVELGCNAAFFEDDADGRQPGLHCLEWPEVLPIAATSGDKCTGDIEFMGWNIGPHDARVFYGPKKPYILFGSNSRFACYGMWLQDFRLLVDWQPERFGSRGQTFRSATELQRPPQQAYGAVEKNWFLFWDKDDRIYVHYDLFPRRAFARIDSTGAAGKDVSSQAEQHDKRCMARYLPKLPKDLESIHQSTNSLRLTMCKRADASCVPNNANTFIIMLIHHKTYYDYHGEYEPYVVVFRQRNPFELYGISKKPLWIHGRQHLTGNRSDMLYVVSINWKARGQKYHGYLDDVLFLSFGIEDHKSGGMDVLAADLLLGLGLCSAGV
ncbi:hypothetical protein B0H66DRAFT_473148 [Apodospora peruviana]|uniref:Uncharacterized protein n=1 Tax=Apodospora peruviana TaxID=516989 RepID=A0AAE0M8R3_9PEZI|nr:hypothetical protein B0H66DRAFT_473148 [Apodospora peruviana]